LKIIAPEVLVSVPVLTILPGLEIIAPEVLVSVPMLVINAPERLEILPKLEIMPVN